MVLMNVQCHRKLCELGRSEIDAFYLVKLIFGKYFYFDDLLQLHLPDLNVTC